MIRRLWTTLWTFSLLLLAMGFVAWATIPAKSNVKDACASDYLTHCSHTQPFSGPCRACMRSVGRKRLLSPGCVAALKAAGEVTQADIQAAKR